MVVQLCSFERFSGIELVSQSVYFEDMIILCKWSMWYYSGNVSVV